LYLLCLVHKGSLIRQAVLSHCLFVRGFLVHTKRPQIMFWFAADFGSQEQVCRVRRKRLSSRQRHLYSPFQVFRHVSFFHSVMCTEAANFQHHVTDHQLFEASRQRSEHEHCLHSQAFCFPDEAQYIGASAFVFLSIPGVCKRE
jgi:hypothetical protein